MKLHIADYVVLAFYFVGLATIGIYQSRKIKNSDDFFMPRKFGKIFMMMFSFGAGTHSDQAVVVASKSFTNGLSGIWYQWNYMFATPFYWLIAPIMRRFRAITTADVFELRFDRSVAMLFSAWGIMIMVVTIGLMLKGSSAVLAASTGGLASANVMIGIMTVLFIIYGVAGGLSAAIITDFIQGVLIIIFSFIFLPSIIIAVGGFEGLRKGLGDPHLLSMVVPADIGIFYIVVISLNGLVGIVGQPHIMSTCSAGKTEMEGRFGFMTGSFLKRLCTIPWSLTGVAAIVYFAGRSFDGRPIDPDKVFGTVANEFLPKLLSGMLGVFVASVVASMLSSCSAFMISSSALFTECFYKRLRPKENKGHYITVARIASVGIVGAGVVFAFWLPGVIKGVEIFWVISSMIAIAFWLGLFWRRATAAGAWASTLVSFGIWLLTSQKFFITFLANLHTSDYLKFIVDKPTGMEISLPWQMVFYLVGGTLAGIIASLITRPVAKEKLDTFYALIITPIKEGEQVRTPCTLPVGAVVPERRKFFPNTNLEIPVPSCTSVIGFLAGWVIVAALILVVYLITKI